MLREWTVTDGPPLIVRLNQTGDCPDKQASPPHLVINFEHTLAML